MAKEFDFGPNRTEVPAEVFAAGLPKNDNAYKDPSEVATELHPDDAEAIEILRQEREARNDRDAAVILRNLKLEDPNSPFPPEE